MNDRGGTGTKEHHARIGNHDGRDGCSDDIGATGRCDARAEGEAIEDALMFAFEALSEGTLCEDAELQITMVKPKSRCLECGAEYEHDRFHMLCPECGSFATELIAGRELQIDSIEVDIPDDDEENED